VVLQATSVQKISGTITCLDDLDFGFMFVWLLKIRELTVWAARLDLLLALRLRPVLAAQRLRVHRREAQRPPELPADQAQ
jgi:hypothetical protein